VIDVKGMTADTIKFGATVRLLDEDSNDLTTYQIVGSDEADIKKGKLSITSPLARALINKTVQDTIEVTTPNGSKAYTIEHIDYI